MATRLPYYVSEGDIYSRIMGQQAAPSAMTDYYAGLTGGYDPGLYQRRRASTAVTGPGSDVSGLLDTGGGGGDLDASGGVSGNPADAIALGLALSAYGGLLGGFAPGGFLAGLAGKGLTSSGITALGELESKAAEMANDQAAMDALAGLSNAAVGQGEAQAIADALANESGLAVAADAQAVANAALDAQAAADMQAALDAISAAESQAALDAQSAADMQAALDAISAAESQAALDAQAAADMQAALDAVAAADAQAAADAAAAAAASNADYGFGYGGADSGGLAGQGASGDTGGDGIGFAKGGKVTMSGLLVDETLPGPDDGYAALQAGEYVIKKSTTKKLGQKKLQALNEGRASIKMRRK